MINLKWMQEELEMVLIPKGHGEHQLRLAFAELTQQIYRHQQITALLYCDLAEKAETPSRRSLFLRMAHRERKHLTQRGLLLRQLGIPVPSEPDNSLDQMWRWLLVQMGPEVALIWVKWTYRRFVSRQTQLLHQMEAHHTHMED